MEQSNLQSLIYETDQAIQAGQAAHVQAQQALSTLRSAKGWGVYDLLGGGLLSGLIKHSRMDKAEQEIAQASPARWIALTASCAMCACAATQPPSCPPSGA